MANTAIRGETGWEITFDGATEWDITVGALNGLATDAVARPKGIHMQSLEVIVAATDDALIVREGSATGRRLFNVLAADAYDERVKYFNDVDGGKYYKLYVKATEVTAGMVLLIET